MQNTPNTGTTSQTQPATNTGRTFTIISFVFAGLTLIIAPLITGIIGVGFGIAGYTKGDRLAVWAIVANVVLAIISIAIVAAMLND